MLQRWRVGEGEVVLLSTVQGLASEADVVARVLDAERPKALAIGVSAEALASMLRYEPDPEADPLDDLPDHDLVYSLKLGEFGDVKLPPPDLDAALDWAQAAGVPYYGVDLPEEAYESAFTREVSVWGFLRYGRIQRRLARKPPRAPDARAFSLAWDARIRKVKGIARVESLREEAIAGGAARLATELAAKVVLLVDVPREAGVGAHLSRRVSSASR